MRYSGSEHILTNDEEAEFTALVQRHSGFLFRVTYAVLLNSHDAEDAVQETFLKLYRNGGWQHAENERAFLARAAWRVAIDRRRSLKAASPCSEASNDCEAAEAVPSHRSTPEQELLDANQHALVHGLIDALPEELRAPLILGAFDDLSSRDIAHILAIPEGTVRTRQQRARHILRKKLESLNVSARETRYA